MCHILGPMDFLCCWKTSFHILVVILTDKAIFHGFAHKILFFSKLDLDQWENLSQSCVLWHIAWHTSHEQSWSNKQGITKNTAKFLILTVFDNYPENVHPENISSLENQSKWSSRLDEAHFQLSLKEKKGKKLVRKNHNKLLK